MKHAERATRFLSLDKASPDPNPNPNPNPDPNPNPNPIPDPNQALPNRDFLQLVQLPGDGSPAVLKYDAEWLAVLRSTAPLFSVARDRVARSS